MLKPQAFAATALRMKRGLQDGRRQAVAAQPRARQAWQSLVPCALGGWGSDLARASSSCENREGRASLCTLPLPMEVSPASESRPPSTSRDSTACGSIRALCHHEEKPGTLVNVGQGDNAPAQRGDGSKCFYQWLVACSHSSVSPAGQRPFGCLQARQNQEV